MKKKTLSIIAAVIALLILLPLGLGVGIKEIYGILSGSSVSSYITFYNARRYDAVLYVKKTVVATKSNAAIPTDDEFIFNLTLNGENVRNREYRLLNADGRQLYKYTDADGVVHYETSLPEGMNEERLETDRQGNFTLKNGQRAEFAGISPGDSYEIKEVITDTSHYAVRSPAGGTSKGTVTSDGATVEFINEYTPDEDTPPDGPPEYGTIKVRKYIEYPANYEMPESPEFTYEIKVGGESEEYLLKDTAYKVYDLETDSLLDDKRSTDSTGQFTLPGNAYALFSNIEVGRDYYVREVVTDEMEEYGWRLISSEKTEGATKEETLVTFTNVQASFGVSKEMYGGISAENSFSFQIVDANSQSFGKSFKYYLYSNTLQLIDPDLQETATDGTFILDAGQRAIFVGVEKGTVYGVRETSTGKYIQYLPTAGAGYEKKVVEDSVEILPFVNAELPETDTLLTVKKSVVNNTEDAEEDVPKIDFTFRISKKVDGEFVPVANAAYDIVDAAGTRTYTAKADGTFTLKAWEVARFIELKKDIEYQVEELTENLPDGFRVVGDNAKGGELGDDPLEIEFTNSYRTPRGPLMSIIKKTNTDKPLAGAKLQLISKDEEGNVTEILHEWISKETPEQFHIVKGGTYYIRELEAPEGYEVAEDVEITVLEVDPNAEEEVKQEFEMINHRDTTVPTGVSWLRSPLGITLIVLGVILIAVVALYFGYFRRRMKKS